MRSHVFLGLAMLVAFMPMARVAAQGEPPNGPRRVDPRWHALVHVTLLPTPDTRVDDATVVIRDGTVITEGRDLEALRRVKDEAKEVRAGTECGIRIAGYEDLKPGDELICYKIVEVKRTLD